MILQNDIESKLSNKEELMEKDINELKAEHKKVRLKLQDIIERLERLERE